MILILKNSKKALFFFLNALLILNLLMPTTALAKEKKDLSLDDLGFKSGDYKSDPLLQKTMEKRSSMLATHQILGLATGAAMLATLFTGKEGDYTDFHLYSGITTGALYATTAYFSLFAPKPDTIKDNNSTKWHRRLAWVHGPAMLLTLVAALAAKNQVDDRKSISGLGELHKPAVAVLVPTFFASLAIMTFDINL